MSSLIRPLALLGGALLLGLAAIAGAGAATVKETESLRDEPVLLANVCIAPPEAVSGTVTLHVNFKVTYNERGEVVSASLHEHAHGAQLQGLELISLDPLAVGGPTGVKYVVKEQVQAPPERVDIPGTKIALRGILTLKLNRQREADGSLLGGDDLYLRIQVLAYEDLTGNQNVVHEKLSFDCK
jgi:hypothetical protein